MRIDTIEIKNFRGVRELVLDELGSTIVIAGANGSGKSCIFDAIRLLKSAYGGYQQNEWHHWMAEFQINFQNNAEAFTSFFQDRSKELSIRCKFRLHQAERNYLQQHGEELVRHSVWRLVAPELYGWSSYRAAPLAAQYRDREGEVQERTRIQWSEMLAELSLDTIEGHIWATAGSDVQFKNSKSLEILFSSYLPGQLGLIDYHGAQRMYTREQVSQVNLDLTAQEQQSRQNALYNYNAKYSNVKSEMAASYIKELLAREAGVPINQLSVISKTLEQLFKTFFPDKKFLGLKPTSDGGLAFPVQTASGHIHDLNELSAGEKEVLYGYLRIRNSAPRYSIILIDEPELHLNPRLVHGLPRFYHEHLGIALDNQIWLVTHSDTLLRDVVGRPEYSVFHMVGAKADSTAKQIERLTLAEDIQRAILSLVGDIASYRPGNKVVLFEGGGDSEFDAYFTRELFPAFVENVNVISSGNKLRVRELHDVLEAASKTQVLPFKTFSITDQDSESAQSVSAPRYRWDVYHIENYLLEASYVLKVMKDIDPSYHGNDNDIYDKLRTAAAASLGALLRHKMTEFVNKSMTSCLSFQINPNSSSVGDAISQAVQRSIDKIAKSRQEIIDPASLSNMESDLKASFQSDIATDSWRKTFRGRDILKFFVSQNTTTTYETFRNLIIARMKDAKFQPPGMKAVLDLIDQA